MSSRLTVAAWQGTVTGTTESRVGHRRKPARSRIGEVMMPCVRHDNERFTEVGTRDLYSAVIERGPTCRKTLILNVFCIRMFYGLSLYCIYLGPAKNDVH